jgi:2-C-methyl-D-erythritol 4-phosphate cytidylyltransferase
MEQFGMGKSVAAIICAAGPGKRFGGKRKKQFTDVAGRAVFLRSVEVFANRDDVKQILLTIPAEDEELVKVKWGANLVFFNVKLVHGGDSRADSIHNALQLVKDDIDLIAVHDAARCCITEKWVDEVIAAAAETGAAILACPLAATIKQVQDGKVVKTVDRSKLYEAQTPQVFEAELLRKANEKLERSNGADYSDDSMLVEAMGHEVAVVETDTSNLKVTHGPDIAIAEAIIKSRPKKAPKGPIGPYAEAQW